MFDGRGRDGTIEEIDQKSDRKSKEFESNSSAESPKRFRRDFSIIYTNTTATSCILVACGYKCSHVDDECQERLLPDADFSQGILFEKAELFYLHYYSETELLPSTETGRELHKSFESYLKFNMCGILQNMIERLCAADSLRACLHGFSPADANSNFIVNLFHLQRSYKLFCHFLLISGHASKEVMPIVCAMKKVEGGLKRVSRKLAKAGLYITWEQETNDLLKLSAEEIIGLLHQATKTASELDELIKHWLSLPRRGRDGIA